MMDQPDPVDELSKQAAQPGVSASAFDELVRRIEKLKELRGK
jgi:hypothetical protein